MSSSSLTQLAESYSKILSATLKHVRETGLLRDAGREVLDELECRWRAAAGRELAAMEARQDKDSGAAPGGQRRPSIAALITGGPSMLTPEEGRFDGTPSIIADTLKRRPPSNFAHMSGVTFAEPFELPALQGRPPVPALQVSEGFGGSHVETPSGPGVLGQMIVGGGSAGSAAQTEAQPLQKKARRQREAEPALLAKPLAPPLDAAGPSRPEAAAAAASGAPPLAPAAAADAASDDEDYDGCFDGAEVIVSSAAENARQQAQTAEQEGAVVPADGAASPAPSDDRPESSQGSELGSDLDDSEFDEPETENVLHAKIARVVKQKKQKWELYFEEGVLMVNGTECLFKSGKGHFTVEEAETAEALEDEAPADAVLADGA